MTTTFLLVFLLGFMCGTVYAAFLHTFEHTFIPIPKCVWMETAGGVIISLSIVYFIGDNSLSHMDTLRVTIVSFIGVGLPIVAWQNWLYENNEDRRLK